MKIKKSKPPPPRKICFLWLFFSCGNNSRLPRRRIDPKKFHGIFYKVSPGDDSPAVTKLKNHESCWNVTRSTCEPCHVFSTAPLAHYWRQLPGGSVPMVFCHRGVVGRLGVNCPNTVIMSYGRFICGFILACLYRPQDITQGWYPGPLSSQNASRKLPPIDLDKA